MEVFSRVIERQVEQLHTHIVAGVATCGQRGANLRSKRQMVTVLLLQDEGEYDD
jgi:hypothetical protein